MGKVYAVSDLHGIYPIFEQIKNFLQPDDKCYVLGDCADRGSEGWRIIKEVMKDNRFIYIKGNHEDMLVRGCRATEFFDGYCRDDYETWIYNGGEQTYLDWLYDINKHQWLYAIDKLPLHEVYINTEGKEIRLCHAGYTPDYYMNCEIPGSEDLLWDRHHFKNGWDEEKHPNAIVVHGHTPTLHVDIKLQAKKFTDKEMEPGAYWYCNNHKVCIDNGTYATGYATMLDLDTFEEHIFECENFVA